MIPHFFICGIWLVSVDFITTFSLNESKSSILLDISEQIEDSNFSRDTTNAMIQSFMKRNRYIGNDQPVLLYYEHSFQKGTYALNLAVNRFQQLKSPFQLLININENATIDHEYNITAFVSARYSGILRIIDQNSFISGVSFEFVKMINYCFVNSPATNTNLIDEVRQFLQSLTAFDIKIGYKLNFAQLKCEGHSDNIASSNYLIINIPLKRNDKVFVESFSVFKNSLKQVETQIKTFLHIRNYSSAVYYKLTLSNNLILENIDTTICGQGHLTLNGRTIIKAALENMVKTQAEYMNRYENLLAEYCSQLIQDGHDANFILKFQQENFNTSRSLVIPQMPKYPVMALGTSGMQSISFLLEEISSSDFNTIIINGQTWQEMVRKGIPKSNCYNSHCRPENVMYLNNKDYAFSTYDRSNITGLLEFDGMHLRALVFSRYYKESSNLNWKQAVESLRMATNTDVRIETGCNELTDIFGEILNNGTFGILCHALELQKTIGCGSLERSSNIIVWRGNLVFKIYDVHDFVENTMKKLDSLVLGRLILQNRINNYRTYRTIENLEIILRINVKYEGQGKTVISNFMYCTDLSTVTFQFYEMLLSWANIHDFTMILEPISGAFGYDNPISWKQLEITTTGRMRNLMHIFPIFIRRSYNTSRVFGSWTTGIYPCIQQSKDLESVKDVNFLGPSTGTTIQINVRTGNTTISTEELEIMLLFAFGKFSTVEVIIRSQYELQTFYDLVQQKTFSENIKANKVSQKNVYIDVTISLSEQLIKIILEILELLEKNGIQVQIHRPNSEKEDLFDFKTGIFVENCIETAYDILSSHYDIYDEIRRAKYIVCDTPPKLAQNEDMDKMRDYLDSHLYLKKLFKYFFRNITGVYFRLHPILVGSTFDDQSENLLLFLADIHQYATAYGIQYFLLPVVSPESEDRVASVWTIRNYTNLSDINNFVERQASLLGLTNWKPIIGKQVSFNQPTITSVTEEESKSASSQVTEYLQIWDTSTNSTYVETNKQPLSTLEYTLIFLGLLVASIVFIAILFKARRHRLTKRIHDICCNPRETGEAHTLEPIQTNERYTKNVSNGCKEPETVLDSKPETSASQKYQKIVKDNIEICYDKILGSGQFGIVYRAKLKDSLLDVAVKMIHDDSPQESLKGMWSEVKLLCGIGKHCNVVGFIGCYYEEIQKGELWIVTELCTRGSLLSFLRDVEAENIDVQLSRRELIKFCLEIAQGMEYIGTKDIIHGDLSTRNVLLDENYTCKIGDFGLSRKLYRYEMYVKQSQEPLPWRWMAYESLTKLQFSPESDVWSYGVTIWEIFTLGNVPYPGMSWSFDFLKDVENGLRLPSPKHASKNMTAMLQKCWELKPKERPSFTELVKFFMNQLEINCDDDDEIIRV